MDVLSDWMRVGRAHGVLIARNLLPSRWGMAMDGRPATVFHHLARGGAWMLVAGRPPLRIEEGDLVLVPRGLGHALVSHLDVVPPPLADVVAKAGTSWPEPPSSTLVCGEYRTDIQVDRGLLEALPDVAHLSRAELSSSQELVTTLALLVTELERGGAAGDMLVRHLLDALLVYVLRAWGAAKSCERGWLSGLADPALARAIERMHSAPAEPWTVESLAKIAHLSRAAFARRFHARLGQPPLEYLTRWRMTLAARMLTDESMGVGEVATRVGYTSEFAFSRAFKRAHGVPPAVFRRSARGLGTEQ